jgi:hypothetical protein
VTVQLAKIFEATFIEEEKTGVFTNMNFGYFTPAGRFPEVKN